MEATIFQLICQILQSNASLLSIAISQRAKFEGWLKFVLADGLNNALSNTHVEESIDKSHVDICCNNSLIEIKTPNTSYTVDGCISKGRPITDNIDGIISDIDKLKKIQKKSKKYINGYIAFVMFPIDNTKKGYQYHINRVISHLGSPSSVCQRPLMINQFEIYVFVAKVF